MVARDYNGKSTVRKSGGDWGLAWLQWAWRQSRQNLLRGGREGTKEEGDRRDDIYRGDQ